MLPISRKQATRRLREAVKDYIAEGGRILKSDDEPIFTVPTSAAREMPATGKAAPQVRWRRPILKLPLRPAGRKGALPH